MTLIFEAGLFKHSEELNTAFLQPLGRTPDNDDELKQNFSATEISFQIAPKKRENSSSLESSSPASKKPRSENETKNALLSDTDDDDSTSITLTESPQLDHCENSKTKGWIMSPDVRALLKNIPKTWIPQDRRKGSDPQGTQDQNIPDGPLEFRIVEKPDHYEVQYCGIPEHQNFSDCDNCSERVWCG
eukprot:GHVP01010108.1.p1 GENE.GHVP01010108.1~~GHVP01010108.1.p1  ORF type:complete len:188 (+),score=21.07 GHVP01010108.1:57-620(+)